MAAEQISLVIFTCEGREHLLNDTYGYFKRACSFSFSKTILAVDGKIDTAIIDRIQPDIVVRSPVRKGYVNNILQALNNIDTEYFFWLEDDWKFHTQINFIPFIDQLRSNSNWVEILYSRDGPVPEELKKEPLATNLFKTPYGFSANPCICKTALIKNGFNNLLINPKGGRLGEDGFENSLTRYFREHNLICVLHDPVDHVIISHEGYLESTSRNWHMTNSLEKKTENHLLTIPAPPFWRKGLMVLKLTGAFFKLAFRQLISNEAYELCFRIVASVKQLGKHD